MPWIVSFLGAHPRYILSRDVCASESLIKTSGNLSSLSTEKKIIRCNYNMEKAKKR